jgi:hypothetical protein
MYKTAALAVLSKRIKHNHTWTPLNQWIDEQVNTLLPMIKAHESLPALWQTTPQGKSDKYQDAEELERQASSFLDDLKDRTNAELNRLGPGQLQADLASISGAVQTVLSKVVTDTGNYLVKHEKDA